MNKYFLFVFILLFSLIAVYNVFAVGEGGTVSSELTNPLNTTDITVILQKIIDFLILIGAPIVGIMVIYGGFLILTAGDSPDKIKQGWDTIKWAAIGYIIVLSSWGILYIIREVTGANIPGL